MNNLQQGFKVDVLSLRRSSCALPETLETTGTTETCFSTYQNFTPLVLTALKNKNLRI